MDTAEANLTQAGWNSDGMTPEPHLFPAASMTRPLPRATPVPTTPPLPFPPHPVRTPAAFAPPRGPVPPRNLRIEVEIVRREAVPLQSLEGGEGAGEEDGVEDRRERLARSIRILPWLLLRGIAESGDES